jgi:SAM-dependent methyltransferase
MRTPLIEQINACKLEGDIFKVNKAFSDAERAYLKAIALKPSLFQVGLPAFKAITLKLGEIFEALGQLYQTQNRTNEAITAFNQALQCNPENPAFLIHFAQSIHLAQFTRSDESLKNHLELCLESPFVDHQHLAIPGISLLKLEPEYSLWVKGMDQKNPQANCRDMLQEQYLHFLLSALMLKLLKNTLITDLEIEMLLTKLRKALLFSVSEPSSANIISAWLPFVYGLARQCFLNEYIFSCSPSETELLTKEIRLVRSCKDLQHLPFLKERLLVISCYRYMDELKLIPKEVFLQLGQPDLQFQEWIEQHIGEWEHEKRCRDQIPCVSLPKNTISQKIRSQYEEHPYPKWESLDRYPPKSLAEYLSNSSPDSLSPEDIESPSHPALLVAGCGTGRQALECATRVQNANVLALDLSLRSLAYGKKMAEKMGVSHIQFLQGDILDLKHATLQFDLIECSGVLHHMEDPLQGWKILRSLLKPKGWMLLGLYSQLGREDVVEARRLIAQMNYQPSLDDIHACREKIRSLSASSPLLHQVSTSLDFYSTSTCRDLLFNAHEVYFSLPQIKAILQELELDFKGFISLRPEVKQEYRKRFPEDPKMLSLDNWDAFEHKYPTTFIGMYQFLAS